MNGFQLSLLFLSVSIYCYGIDVQGTVTGIPANNAVTGASCLIVTGDSLQQTTLSSGISDAEGRFNLTVDDYHGSAVLKVEKNGFETFTENLEIGDEDINVGECILTEVSNLQELVVEGAAVVATDGNILYTPMKSTVEASSYAVDLIGRLGIPALSYNPRERTLESMMGKPVILINGRPADMRELQSLNADEVMNVEYSNNVPVIYGEGDFLINVKLKKKENGGIWNVLEINDFIGTYILGQTSLRFHQGSSSWLIDGSFNYCNNKDTYDNAATCYTAPQMPVELLETSHSPFNYKNSDATLQYNFIPSADFMLSATYRFSN